MATKAQIAANRRNAQLSTGPRTDAGKAATRQNALRHGLCAGNSSELDELLAILREEHQPVGAAEEILVYKMAESFYNGKRANNLLTEQLELAQSGENNSREVALMLRYYTTADRGYYRALTDLRKLQKERRLQEIGSVSQNPEVPAFKPAPEPPSQPTTARTQPGDAVNLGRALDFHSIQPLKAAA